MVYGLSLGSYLCLLCSRPITLAFLGCCWRIDLSEFRGIMTGVGWVNDGPAHCCLVSAWWIFKAPIRRGKLTLLPLSYWSLPCHLLHDAYVSRWTDRKNATWPKKKGHLRPQKTRVSHDMTPSQVWKMNSYFQSAQNKKRISFEFRSSILPILLDPYFFHKNFEIIRKIVCSIIFSWNGLLNTSL